MGIRNAPSGDDLGFQLVRLAADQVIAAAAFANIPTLTFNLIIQEGRADCFIGAGIAGSMSAAGQSRFRFSLVDPALAVTNLPGKAFQVDAGNLNLPMACNLFHIVNLPVGLNTINLQLNGTAGNTQLRPVAAPDSEGVEMFGIVLGG